MSRPTSKFGGALAKLRQEPASNPETGEPENLKAGKQESPIVPAPAPTPEPAAREKYSTSLPSDLVKAMKLHAVKAGVKDYAVVEAALREYLERHGD